MCVCVFIHACEKNISRVNESDGTYEKTKYNMHRHRHNQIQVCTCGITLEFQFANSQIGQSSVYYNLYRFRRLWIPNQYMFWICVKPCMD